MEAMIRPGMRVRCVDDAGVNVLTKDADYDVTAVDRRRPETVTLAQFPRAFFYIWRFKPQE